MAESMWVEFTSSLPGLSVSAVPSGVDIQFLPPAFNDPFEGSDIQRAAHSLPGTVWKGQEEFLGREIQRGMVFPEGSKGGIPGDGGNDPSPLSADRKGSLPIWQGYGIGQSQGNDFPCTERGP